MEITWDTFQPRAVSNIKKLSLDKEEQARVCFLQQRPQLVFVHSFEKIVTGPNGKPIEVKDTWPDGSERVKVKTEYAGKLRCLGDEDVVSDAGADPENCPACRAHIENPSAVKAAQRRYLGHVLKYSTKPGSWNPSKPFAAQLLVWDLTENRFGQLKDIYDEHGPLPDKDLLLGPCENKQMQKYNIQVGGEKALWKNHEEYVTELLAEEKMDDLASVAAKKPSAEEMRIKVSEITRAYNHAYGVTSGAASYESIIDSSNVSDLAASAEDDDEEAEDFDPGMASEDDDDDDSENLTGELDALLGRLGG